MRTNKKPVKCEAKGCPHIIPAYLVRDEEINLCEMHRNKLG